MSFNMFIITNPVSLFIVLFAVKIILRIVFYFFHINWAKDGNWWLKIHVVLFLISIVINFRMLFTNDFRKSLVDVSPFAALSSEQISRLEDIIETFKDYDLEGYEITKTPKHLSFYKFCNFWYHGKESYLGALSVGIRFYWDEQGVVEHMRFNTVSWLYKKNIFITNDNNTQVLLYHSRMEREFGPFYIFPSATRDIISRIRLGNAVILLREAQHQDRLKKNVSSDFIKWLCEKLTE